MEKMVIETKANKLAKSNSDDDTEDDDIDWDEFLWKRETSSILDFPLSVDGQADRVLKMHQNWSGNQGHDLGSADGLHTTVWEAAIAMYLYFMEEERKTPNIWRGKRVLELGSGTGLVGLTLAALGADVVMSELPAAVPLLQHNITSNTHVLEDGRARAITLTWGEEEGEIAELLKSETPFDMVVGADIIYHQDLFPPLKASINYVCGAGTDLYLCRLQRGTDPSKSQRFYDELSEFNIDMKFLVVGGAAKSDSSTEASEHEALFEKYRELADQNQTLSFELLRGTRGSV